MQTTAGFCSEESRRIQCTKCGNSHIWICTNRSKATARWCQVLFIWEEKKFWHLLGMHNKWSWFCCVQDCCQYHQGKDGDGWVEYKGSLVFDRLQKVYSLTRLVWVDFFDASSVEMMGCAFHVPFYHYYMASSCFSPHNGEVMYMLLTSYNVEHLMFLWFCSFLFRNLLRYRP